MHLLTLKTRTLRVTAYVHIHNNSTPTSSMHVTHIYKHINRNFRTALT
jgi:hypothetical protein